MGMENCTTDEVMPKKRDAESQSTWTRHCDVCRGTFHDPTAFQIHQLEHQLQNPFKCAVCEAAFPDAEVLTKHIQVHKEDLAEQSSANQTVTGQDAGVENDVDIRRSSRREQLSDQRIASESTKTAAMNDDARREDHLSNVINEIHNVCQCEKCGRTMRSNYHYQMHVRSCDGSGARRRARAKLDHGKPGRQQCDICMKICISEYHLRLHRQKHDKVKVRKLTRCICSQCNKCFVNLTTLRNHVAYVHASERNFECDVCHKSFTRKNTLELHKKTHSNVHPYSCDLCSAMFKRKDAVLTHKKRKHSETVEDGKKRKFYCEICNQLFPDKTHYKIHSKNTDSKNKKVMCELCGNWYVSTGSLRQHFKTVHERIRRFGCEDCGQKFLQRSALNVHRAIHTSEKPFLCDACGKAFRTKKVLERHKDSHSKVKSFQCSVCRKEFSRGEHLRRHQKTHAPNRGAPERKFSCEICNRTFTTRRYLRDHETTHYRDGDRPFKCDVCGLRFTQDLDLQRHLLEHDGHRDIVCHECDKHFKSSEQFHFHLRSAHQQEPDPRIEALLESKRKETDKKDISLNLSLSDLVQSSAGGQGPVTTSFASSNDQVKTSYVANSTSTLHNGTPLMEELSPQSTNQIYPPGVWSVAQYRL